MYKKKIALLITFIITILGIALYALAEENDYVSVNVFDKTYLGTLTAMNEKDLMLFISAPNYDIPITIYGKWQNDSFTQNCTITYQDGTIQNVTYKNGLISGKVTSTFPDNTYQIFSCNNGKPYKKITTYSANDIITGEDWFYSCVPMSTLVDEAISVDYNTLFSNPYNYINLPVKISGVVDTIYEAEKHCVMLIRDANSNLYVFRHQNYKVDTYHQANIPNLSIGDKVEITGLFLQLRNFEDEPLTIYPSFSGNDYPISSLELSDTEYIQTTKKFYEVEDIRLQKDIPEFSTVYCKKLPTDIDPQYLSGDYSEICTYPFYYIDQDISLTGTVLQEFQTSDTLTELIVQKKDSSEIYAVSYKTQNFEHSLLGSTISLKGKLNGNNKFLCFNLQTSSVGYIIYPNISSQDLNVVSK